MSEVEQANGIEGDEEAVERVAKALKERLGEWPTRSSQDLVDDLARAAIAALRGETE